MTKKNQDIIDDHFKNKKALTLGQKIILSKVYRTEIGGLIDANDNESQWRMYIGSLSNLVSVKKVLSILALALFLSCTPEAIPAVIAKDCECDKVVEFKTMNIVGVTNGVTKYYSYTTINECSGLQRTSGWVIDAVKIGDCK